MRDNSTDWNAAFRRLAVAMVLAGVLATADRATAQCVGDCNGDGQVTINELVIGVNIVLELQPVSRCMSFDSNDSNAVEINELVQGVNGILTGCPATPTPTPTRLVETPTPTPTIPPGCGDEMIDLKGGETCDASSLVPPEENDDFGGFCPSSCRIMRCTRSGTFVGVNVEFSTEPADLLIQGLTLVLRYPDGIVDVPGTGNDAAVQGAVSSDVFSVTPNDRNFNFQAVLVDPSFIGVEAGVAMTIAFDLCEEATGSISERQFHCRVLSAASADEKGVPIPVTDQVQCRVTLLGSPIPGP